MTQGANRPSPPKSARRRGHNRVVSSPPPTYPLVPRSTSRLTPGQHWSVPRDDGFFGVGLVLGVATSETSPHHPASTRTLVVGLLDRVLARPASPGDLRAPRLVDWGFAHVRCVALTSGGLGPAGVADLPLNDVLKVSHRGGGSVGPQTVVVSHRHPGRDQRRGRPSAVLRQGRLTPGCTDGATSRRNDTTEW